MDSNVIKRMNVGEIVTNDFTATRVFKRYGIDFCCHGDTSLEVACRKQNIDVDNVIKALEEPNTQSNANIPFASWPLDLLLDYVLKIHHRGIRKNGPELLKLIAKVKSVHGERHPELNEIESLVTESLEELEMHLQKEENVLFPYLYELFEADEEGHSIEQMHCGTISNPIKVMRMEHENEGVRYLHIREITNHFTTPADGCASYRMMMEELEAFVDALFEHIHIENNILFPRFEELENKTVINRNW